MGNVSKKSVSIGLYIPHYQTAFPILFKSFNTFQRKNKALAILIIETSFFKIRVFAFSKRNETNCPRIGYAVRNSFPLQVTLWGNV